MKTQTSRGCHWKLQFVRIAESDWQHLVAHSSLPSLSSSSSYHWLANRVAERATPGAPERRKRSNKRSWGRIRGLNPQIPWIQGVKNMSMTAGEGDGGAGMMDDASCNSLAETATVAAGERDGTGSLVERCAGDGD